MSGGQPCPVKAKDTAIQPLSYQGGDFPKDTKVTLLGGVLLFFRPNFSAGLLALAMIQPTSYRGDQVGKGCHLPIQPVSDHGALVEEKGMTPGGLLWVLVLLLLLLLLRARAMVA